MSDDGPWCPRCLHTVEKVVKWKERTVCVPCADELELNEKGYGVFILGSSGRIIP